MTSVIILSYNTRKITLKCLKRLSESKNVDLEIIVVDNASTDGSQEAITEKFPQVKLIANKNNVGFAVGNNQGIKASKGDTILLLNSDCFVQPNTLTITKRQMLMAKWDVIGCQLLNPDGSIQPSWGYFPTLWRIFLLMTFIDNFPLIRKFAKTIHVRDLSRCKTREVDWVMGAFVLMKKEVFVKTGGFDSRYFMYGEEIEWMYRIKKAGFRIGYFSNAQATHLGGASTKSQAKMQSSELKGYLYWFSKHDPKWKLPVLKIILVLGSLYKTLAWPIIGPLLNKPRQAKENWAIFRSILSFAWQWKPATSGNA